ncbi:MAG: FtsX-like permease family protein [Chloroflexota bacterium]
MLKLLQGVLYKKIKHDLFGQGNSRRTMQAVLSIFAGAFALGAILGALDLISQDTTQSWINASPASIQLRVSPGASEDVVTTLSKMDEVAETEGDLAEPIQWRPDPSQPWESATLKARPDYDDQRFFAYTLVEGQWPERKTMVVQEGYDLSVGDQVELEINGRTRSVDLGGVVRAVNVRPSNLGGTPTFYTTQSHFEEITGRSGFALIYGSVPEYTQEIAEAAATAMEDQLENQGFTVTAAGARGETTVSPDEHFMQDTLDGVFLILIIMGVASLLLGLLLVYNTVSAIISQQVSQIGVLKAIGASRQQILIIYFTIAFIYGVLALILALIFGALAAHGLRTLLTTMMGIETGRLTLSSSAAMVQILVSLITPLAVATGPILQGSGITVREAISSYGLTGGGGWLDTLLAKLTFMSRMVAMAISNTFRNKIRVSLVLVALVGAGMMFIGVLSVQNSINRTFNDIYLDIFQADITFTLSEPERIDEMTTLTRDYAAVDLVEMHLNTQATASATSDPDAGEETTSVTGIPVPSSIYQPNITAGRWLVEEDRFAVVVNEALAEALNVTLGDRVTLDISGESELEWQIVGLIYEPILGNANVAYTPQETLQDEMGEKNQANQVWVRIHSDSQLENSQHATQLRASYASAGIEPTITNEDTLAEKTASQVDSLSVLVLLLFVLAVIIAAVGAIALSGVLGINVLERRREIGVLRSIGAGNRSISTLFITEGILLGWLSWIIAVPFSIATGDLLTTAVESALGADFTYVYSPLSLLYWFVIITILAVFASWTPTKQAIEVSVRESLSYE